MAEAERLSALSGHYQTGDFGASGPDTPGVLLSERRPSALAQVNGAPGLDALAGHLKAFKLDTPPAANRSAAGPSARFMWNGPGQWLVESSSLAPADLIAKLENALSDTSATVTDLSHARTVVRLDGKASRALLCKGCPLDIERMQAGDSATSLMGQLTVQIHCAAESVFDLYVFRSFGLALWETLTDEAGEFGYRVLEAG